MLVGDLWSHTLGQGEVVSAEWRLVIRLLKMHLKTNDPFKRSPFSVQESNVPQKSR